MNAKTSPATTHPCPSFMGPCGAQTPANRAYCADCDKNSIECERLDELSRFDEPLEEEMS